MDANILLAFAGLIVAVGTFLWTALSVGRKTQREISRLRTNDLHDIMDRLTRIEEKLDRHLEWHSRAS